MKKNRKNRLSNCSLVLIVIFFFTTIKIMANPIDSLKVDVEVSEFIYENASFPQSHASTIAETDEGLVAAWFGGTHEKHPDVSIYSSIRTEEEWSSPHKIADGVINDTLRYPCWNPVLYNVPN